MQEQLKIAGAFVGVIVGAGFASGRELLLFFVDFGVWGLVGALVSAALFTFLGMARWSAPPCSPSLAWPWPAWATASRPLRTRT